MVPQGHTFFDDLIYGKKPKPKMQPESYEDYVMREEDYWKMVDETSEGEALLTRKMID